MGKNTQIIVQEGSLPWAMYYLLEGLKVRRKSWPEGKYWQYLSGVRSNDPRLAEGGCFHSLRHVPAFMVHSGTDSPTDITDIVINTLPLMAESFGKRDWEVITPKAPLVYKDTGQEVLIGDQISMKGEALTILAVHMPYAMLLGPKPEISHRGVSMCEISKVVTIMLTKENLDSLGIVETA